MSSVWPSMIYNECDNDSEGVPSVHSMSEDEEELSTSIRKLKYKHTPVREILFDPEPYEPEHIFFSGPIS